VNEADWQRQVTDLADFLGWTWLHIRPARIRDRHLTPVAGALGPGWFDLTLLRERLILIELKTDTGRVSGVQRAVHAAATAAGLENYVIRPRDFEFLMAVLERRVVA
jgi:hypothetical protein